MTSKHIDHWARPDWAPTMLPSDPSVPNFKPPETVAELPPIWVELRTPHVIAGLWRPLGARVQIPGHEFNPEVHKKS